MPYTYDFPRALVTVDCLVLNSNKQVLLIKRLNDPFKDSWALPGGFIEMDETLIDSAYRELKEETGIENVDLIELATYGEPGRDPRGRTMTILFGGILRNSDKVIAGDDAKEAKWFTLDELPDLAFDHKQIIEENKSRLLNH